MTLAGAIRLIAALAIVALFVVDYGYAAMAKAVPSQVYYGLAAIVVGVDIESLRKIIQSAIARLIGAEVPPDEDKL